MNDRPTFAELRALAAIATRRSFRKAADQLDLSPSTLSHMMTGLETRLGARLLNRTTRSVAPTAAGERLVAKLGPILAELDGALAEVDTARDTPGGTLRITASETVAMLLLQGAIPRFLALYPEMRLDMVADPAFVDIVAEGFDAGLRLGEAVPRDMIAARLGGPSRMVAVAAPSYLVGRAVPETPEDLAAHRCIGSRTPAGRPDRWTFEHEGHSLSVDVAGPLVLNRTELMVAAALNGVGIAFVPQRLAQPHLQSGALRLLLDEWSPRYPGLFLYYPGHRHVPIGLRLFIDVLKAWFAEEADPRP